MMKNFINILHTRREVIFLFSFFLLFIQISSAQRVDTSSTGDCDGDMILTSVDKDDDNDGILDKTERSTIQDIFGVPAIGLPGISADIEIHRSTSNETNSANQSSVITSDGSPVSSIQPDNVAFNSGGPGMDDDQKSDIEELVTCGLMNSMTISSDDQWLGSPSSMGSFLSSDVQSHNYLSARKSDDKEQHLYLDPAIEDPISLLSTQWHDDTFHLFSHGAPGILNINGKWLNKYEISIWLKENVNIQKFSHINIYGCEF